MLHFLKNSYFLKKAFKMPVWQHLMHGLWEASSRVGKREKNSGAFGLLLRRRKRKNRQEATIKKFFSFLENNAKNIAKENKCASCPKKEILCEPYFFCFFMFHFRRLQCGTTSSGSMSHKKGGKGSMYAIPFFFQTREKNSPVSPLPFLRQTKYGIGKIIS